MSKINFTKEHQERLNALAGEALIKGTIFKAHLGTESNIYNLFHDYSINSLQSYNKRLKKEVEDSETDDWTNNEYQERKLSDLKKRQELIFLIIGFKKSEEERNSNRIKASSLRAELATLKEANKTPEEKLKEKEAELAALESSLN